MSTPSAPVLMSGANPTGWKLEELLAQMIQDLRVKNDALERDRSETSRAVQVNNAGVIDCLALALVRQQDTLRRLDLLGLDPGPHGTPRIGALSPPEPAAPVLTPLTAAADPAAAPALTPTPSPALP